MKINASLEAKFQHISRIAWEKVIDSKLCYGGVMDEAFCNAVAYSSQLTYTSRPANAWPGH